MVESGRRLEGILRVAAETIGAELPRMLVLMAASAFSAKAEKRSVHIFQHDLGPGAGRNPGRSVTRFAFLLSMPASQSKARLGEVVESAAVKTNERNSLPLVFLVAAPAIRLLRRGLVRTRVKPNMTFHPAPDLGVALQTLECARACSKIVTRPALGHAIQLPMSA